MRLITSKEYIELTGDGVVYRSAKYVVAAHWPGRMLPDAGPATGITAKLRLLATSGEELSRQKGGAWRVTHYRSVIAQSFFFLSAACDVKAGAVGHVGCSAYG
jgi:hypothetical protein